MFECKSHTEDLIVAKPQAHGENSYRNVQTMDSFQSLKIDVFGLLKGSVGTVHPLGNSIIFDLHGGAAIIRGDQVQMGGEGVQVHALFVPERFAFFNPADYTKTMNPWKDIPYYPISRFYKETFGEKVYKVPVSTAETCPNREGLKGMKTCNFCDVWGSAAYPEIREKKLKEQIETTKARMANMFNARKFLVYFQAYTNTFEKTSRLSEQFELAFSYEDIIGAVIGTRPDCISPAVLRLWNQWAETHFMAVEIGVQTFNNDQLDWMRRGHTAEKSLWAIQKISEECPKVNLGIHLMFGLPGETDEQIIETAKLVNSLPIQNVKLHNLHVLKNTPLEEDYRAGAFEPISKELYFERCRLFLQHLSPEIAVHRLSALSKHAEELVAPEWTSRKMEMYQHMLDLMKNKNSWQGQLYHP